MRREREIEGDVFPARACCSGAVSLGSCLGPVGGRGYMCVGGVYVDTEIRWHFGKACEKKEHLSAQ